MSSPREFVAAPHGADGLVTQAQESDFSFSQTFTTQGDALDARKERKKLLDEARAEALAEMLRQEEAERSYPLPGLEPGRPAPLLMESDGDLSDCWTSDSDAFLEVDEDFTAFADAAHAESFCVPRLEYRDIAYAASHVEQEFARETLAFPRWVYYQGECSVQSEAPPLVPEGWRGLMSASSMIEGPDGRPRRVLKPYALAAANKPKMRTPAGRREFASIVNPPSGYDRMANARLGRSYGYADSPGRDHPVFKSESGVLYRGGPEPRPDRRWPKKGRKRVVESRPPAAEEPEGPEQYVVWVFPDSTACAREADLSPKTLPRRRTGLNNRARKRESMAWTRERDVANVPHYRRFQRQGFGLKSLRARLPRAPRQEHPEENDLEVEAGFPDTVSEPEVTQGYISALCEELAKLCPGTAVAALLRLLDARDYLCFAQLFRAKDWGDVSLAVASLLAGGVWLKLKLTTRAFLGYVSLWLPDAPWGAKASKRMRVYGGKTYHYWDPETSVHRDPDWVFPLDTPGILIDGYPWFEQPMMAYQSYGESSFGTKLFRASLHSPLSKQVAAIGASLFAMGAKLEQEPLTLFMESVVKHLNHVAVYTTATEQILNLVDFWKGAWAQYEVTGNVLELFGTSREDMYLRRVTAFTESLRGQRFSPDSHARANMEQGKDLLRHAIQFKSPVVLKAVDELKAEVTRMAQSVAAERVPPAGFLFFGEPGTGKSSLTRSVEACMQKKFGVDKEVRLVHTWQDSSHEQFPSIVSILEINDAFSVKDEHRNGQSEAKLIQMIVDMTPFRAEGASLADKENSNIAPDIVLISTNSESYLATTMTGGVDKLDRRLISVHVVFTEKCDSLAEELGETKAEVYRRYGKNTRGLVEFHVGRMDQSVHGGAKNKINFEPVRNKIVLKSPEAMVAYVLKTEAARETEPVTHMEPCHREGCYLPEGACECYLRYNFGEMAPGQVGRDLDLDSFGSLDRVDEFDSHSSGSRHSDEEEEAPLVRRQGTGTSGLKKRLTRASYAMDMLEDLEMLAAAARVLGALVAVAAGLSIIRNVFDGFSWLISSPAAPSPCAQGMVGAVRGMAEDRAQVPPYASTKIPWLTATGNVKIKLGWGGSFDQWGVLVSHNVLAVANHFFHEDSEWSNKLGPRRKEGVITYEYAGRSGRFIFDEERVHQVAGSDRAYLHFDVIPGIPSGVYNRLPAVYSRPSPNAVATFDGQEVPIIPSTGGTIKYRRATVRGECGKMLECGGEVLALHVGLIGLNEGVGAPISRAEADAAMDVFTRRGFPCPLYSNDMSPMMEKQGAGPGAEGVHPKSDAAWVDAQTPLESLDHIPVYHRPLVDKPKMTGKPTKLEPALKGKLAEPYGTPNTGHATVVDGEWKSIPVNRLRNMDMGEDVCVATNVMRLAQAAYVEGIPVTALEPLTEFQAITGDERNALINPRDNSKSVGPTLAMLQVTKRNAFVKQPEGDYVMHPTVKVELARTLAELRGTGPLPPTVCQATVKDEVLPLSKLAKRKGRLFYVQDWCDNTAMRMYLLPIMAWLSMHPAESGVVTTINAASRDWGSLAEKILAFGGERVVAADQTAYDLHHNIMLRFYRTTMVALSKRLGYSDEDARVLGRVLDKFSRYLVSLEGNWFICTTGLTSGRSDTIVANCVIMVLLNYYAALVAYPTRPPRSVVFALATGDDSITSVARDAPALTPELLDEAFGSLGYVITSADKSGPVKFESLWEISHLKRRFLRIGGRIFAPLAEESIYRSLCYMVGVSADMEDLRNLSAVDSAAREMFMHGPERYEAFLAEIATVLPKYCPKSYRELEGHWEAGTLHEWTVPQTLTITDSTQDTFQCQGSQPLALTYPTARGVRSGEAEQGGNLRVPNNRPHNASTVGSFNQPRAQPTSLNAVDELIVESTAAPVLEIRTEEVTSTTMEGSMTSARKDTPQIDLDAYFARPRLVKSIPLSTPAVQVSVFQEWSAISAVASVIDNYSLWRGDPTVHITFTGSSQMMGMVRVAAIPDFPNAPYGTYESNGPITNWNAGADNWMVESQLPHVDIDLAQPGSYKLVLKYPLGRDYMEDGNNDWKIRMSVVNPLQLANGKTPPDPSLFFYVHYDSFKMDRIVRQGKGSEAPPGHVERAMAYAKAVAANMPGPYAAPALMVSTVGEAVAKFAGWSKPPVEPQDINVVRRFGNPALASGQPNFGQNMSVDPNVQRNMDVDVIPMAVEGETSFRSLVSRETQIIRNWTEGKAVYVDPGLVRGTNPFVVTTMGYVSAAFERWTGDIKLCVEVKSSPLVRWRIGVNIIPPGMPNTSAFIADGTIHAFVIEVVGSVCTDIVVPYLYAEPWRKFAFINADVGLESTELTRVKWFALMDALGPSETPVVPEVNLYMSGGDNYSVGIPSMEELGGYTLQGMGLGEQSTETFGEVIDDLTLLTRRSSMVARFTSPVGPTNAMIWPLAGFEPIGDFTNPPYGIYEESEWSFRFWFQQMFLGNTGGIAIKVRGPDRQYRYTSALTAPALGLLVTVDQETTPFPTARGATYHDKDAILDELIFPDRNTYRFRYARASYTVVSNVCECMVMLFPDDLAEGVRFDLWEAGADDFRVGGFLAPPVLRVRDTA